MINQISKIQKIVSGQSGSVILNTSLPVSIKVVEKTGYNRYILEFNEKKLNTKSMKNLKIGGQYWGEISSGSENIVIQNLYEKPNFIPANTLLNGIDLIERLVNEPQIDWFYDHIKDKLTTTNSKAEFEIYTNMLMALQKKIIYIPFMYGKNVCIFEMKIEKNDTLIYIIFSNFPPILFSFEGKKCNMITTPFKKLAKFLECEFETKTAVKEVVELYSLQQQILDLKS